MTEKFVGILLDQFLLLRKNVPCLKISTHCAEPASLLPSVRKQTCMGELVRKKKRGGRKLEKSKKEKKGTRQESSMIHSASPQARPAVIVA